MTAANVRWPNKQILIECQEVSVLSWQAGVCSRCCVRVCVCVCVCVCVWQHVLPSAVLAHHSALVNTDLCRELISVTQQMEELKIRHRLVNCCHANIISLAVI